MRVCVCIPPAGQYSCTKATAPLDPWPLQKSKKAFSKCWTQVPFLFGDLFNTWCHTHTLNEIDTCTHAHTQTITYTCCTITVQKCVHTFTHTHLPFVLICHDRGAEKEKRWSREVNKGGSRQSNARVPVFSGSQGWKQTVCCQGAWCSAALLPFKEFKSHFFSLSLG